MTNFTKTSTSHYEVQKKRRAQFIEEWRHNHRTVIHGNDVEMHETSRRVSTGVYLGKDGDSPVRTVDAAAHQVASGSVSTIHRHSWDAVMFRTLPEHYDPRDRNAAMNYIYQAKASGEVPTGLLFIDRELPDIHDLNQTVDEPLINLPLEKLCPGNSALVKFQESFR